MRFLWLLSGVSSVGIPAAVRDFLYSKTSRPALGVKWPGRGADLSPPSSSEVKNEWNAVSSPVICVRGVDSFIFTFTFPLKSRPDLRVFNFPST